MLELPWNFLWERLGKFLELTYVVTILSGLIIAAEVAAIFSSGSPEYKQGLVISYLSRFDRNDLDLLTFVAGVLLAAIFAYLIGYTARALFITAYGLLTRTFFSIRHLIQEGFWALAEYQEHGGRGDKASPRSRRLHKAMSRFDDVVMSLPPLFELREAWHNRTTRWRSLRDRYLPALRAYSRMPEAIWGSLIYTHGESDVKRVLAKHSFGADFQYVDNNFKLPDPQLPDRYLIPPSMESVYEYCSAWLKRYAPDLNPPQDLRRWGLRYSWAVPIILAPAAYSSVASNSMIADHPTLFTLLAIALTLWMIRSPQAQLRSYPPLVFQRFVMAQFLFETRPQDDSKDNQLAPKHTATEQAIPSSERQSSS
jgi:hypothetical protein